MSTPDPKKTWQETCHRLRDGWTPDTRAEPLVRIGIILAQDGYTTVRLTLPARRSLLVDIGPESVPLEPDETLQLDLAGDRLTLRASDGRTWTSETAHVTPAETPARWDDGITVHGVLAGRGFHWQKRIDVRLPGALDAYAGRRGIILVNELPLEHSLAGVITAEMSGACPVEFLKAQCVVARSWLLALTEPKHEGQPFDRCNDDCCQRYQGLADLGEAARQAVDETRGLVLLDPAGRLLDANYAKSCGGISEEPRYVWGFDKPGLAAVVDAPPDGPERQFFPVSEANLDQYLDGAWLAGARAYCSPQVVRPEHIGRYLGRVDEADDYFRWTVRYQRSELEDLLREKVPELRRLALLRDMRVVERGVSGRASVVELEWQDAEGRAARTRLESEYRIRAVLHRKFLYSSAIAVRLERDAGGTIQTVTLRGAGWGHGAGLCQIGALGMALLGHDCETICRHYYPDARLERVYA